MELKSCPDCNREWGVCDEVTNRFEMREARFCGTCGRPINGNEPPNEPEKVLCKCIANVEGRCVAEKCEGAVVAFDVKIFTPEQAKEFYQLINSIIKEEAEDGPRDFVPWEAGSNGKMGGVEPRGSE